MRPSMRLPLREAKFVCSSCRIAAAPRISPLGQFRHYASNSPGFLERTRRRLWGTDTPPGQADPYSGSQIMPGSAMSPAEAQTKPAEEEFSLAKNGETQTKTEETEFVNLEDMPKIGYLKEQEWRLKGPNEKVDVVKPWYNNPQRLSHSEAVHQAVVEIGLSQMMGKDISGLNFDEHRKKIRATKISGQGEQWGDRLRFTSEKSMRHLLRFVGGHETETAFNAAIEKLKDAGKLDNRLYDAKVPGSIQSSLKSLPLTDGQVKFDFFSRLSKLTSQRISDSVITSSTTIGEVFTAHKAFLKTTNRLNPTLLHRKMDQNGTAELSNVKIFDVRQTRHDNDEDLGRKKAIVTALYSSGLIKRALKKKVPKRTT